MFHAETTKKWRFFGSLDRRANGATTVLRSRMGGSTALLLGRCTLATGGFFRFTWRMRPLPLLAALSFAAIWWCEGAGTQSQKTLLAFHLEGQETDNPKMIVPVKLGTDHRQYFFSKIPSFTDRDVLWFYPFTAADGVSYGAAFRLKEHAAQELKALSLTNQGRLLGLRCADAPMQAVVIDRPIDDGVVVVWMGLQQKHLQQFRKKFPHVDDYQPKAGPQFALPN